MINQRRPLALALTVMLSASVPVLAQVADHTAVATQPAINLDLSSSERNQSAAHLVGTESVNIVVSGAPVSVSSASVLTPAERLAVYQVVSTGAQSIQIGANGAAIGGSLVVGARFSNFVSSLTVPEGVTVLFDAARSPAMNLTGNLTNNGTIYAFSSNAQVSTASISALNILNQTNAVISTVLPSGGLFGFTSAVSSMNLNLTAVQNIVNSGTIFSSGNLSAVAGGSITNSVSSGPSALMQAVGALNLQASSLVNQGVLASLANNLSVTTASLTNSGTLQALAGQIEIQSLNSNTLAINNVLGEISARDLLHLNTGEVLEGTLDLVHPKLMVSGGELTASIVEIYSPCGDIDIDVHRLNGDVGIKAANANIKVEGGDLNITHLDLSGDPSFTNATGDVNLGPGPAPAGTASFNIFSGGPTFTTGGALFSVSAGKDIVALNGAAGTVDASLFGGTGGAITLTAGTSGNGGSVLLPSINFRTNGNSITITAAASGTNAGSVSVGNLNTSGAGGVCCQNNPAGGAAGQDAGAITITAPGGISTGSIQAFGGGGAGGFCCSANGGRGGNGGTVTLTTNGNVAIGGEINTSGGGGGGLAASQMAGRSGGAGGNAGNIIVSGLNIVSFGPLLSAGGGGGAGNTVPPCCPQGYRSGGGSFGGGGGGGDVGAGGGGFYGGGGSLSVSSGGGGGFFGGGGGAAGQQSGSLGRGGDSSQPGTLFFTGGVFGAAGGGAGSSGGDGNLINNTFVTEKGFGNAGGAGGINGNITMNATSVKVLQPVGAFFPGTGFSSSPFANQIVFGNYSGPQVNAPGGAAAPTNTVANIPRPAPTITPPTRVTIGLTDAQLAALQGLTSLDGSQSGGLRNYDTSGLQNVTDWGLMMQSTGQTILVNNPNSNNSMAGIIAYQPTGVSSAGNSLSAAMNSLDTDIGQILVSLSRRSGEDYNAPGREATGVSQSGPLVGTLTDPITMSMVNALWTLLELRNAVAAKQAEAEGRYSWSGMGSYFGGGFGSLPTYDGSDGFVSHGSYNQDYVDWQNRPTTSSTFDVDTNALTAWRILQSDQDLLSFGGQGDGPGGGSGGGSGGSAPGAVGTVNGQKVTFTPKDGGVVVRFSDGREYSYPNAKMVPGAGGMNVKLPSGVVHIPGSGGNITLNGGRTGTYSALTSGQKTADGVQAPSNPYSPRPGTQIQQPIPDGQWNSTNQTVEEHTAPPPNGTPYPILDLPVDDLLSLDAIIDSVAFSEEEALSRFALPAGLSDGTWLARYPMLAAIERKRAKSDRREQRAPFNPYIDGDMSVSVALLDSPFPWPAAVADAASNYVASNPKPKNLFLCPTQQFSCKTDFGTLTICAGAKVLVLRNEHCIGIYNLHDNHRDDVSMIRDECRFTVAPGKLIILCREANADFDSINPGRPIAYRGLSKLPSSQGAVYAGDFSPVTALTSVSCLKNLPSGNVSDRKTYKQLIKTAVAISQLQRSGVAFKVSPEQPTAKSEGGPAHVIARRLELP